MTPSRLAAIAAIVASVGLTAFAPAMARDMTQERDMRAHRMLEFRAGPAGRFELAQFTCAPNAAARLEKRFDGLAGRLKLTDEQIKLYDAFMTSALTAQTRFADQCDELRPARATRADRAERPGPVERMEGRIRFDEARLAAMNAVLPDFKAFYQSLTAEQQADLFPFGEGRHHHPSWRKSGDNGSNG